MRFLAPRNLFVDAATTQDPLTATGTLEHPFKTIQAAIDWIVSHPATDASDWTLGYTVYIAGNVYAEDSSYQAKIRIIMKRVNS